MSTLGSVILRGTSGAQPAANTVAVGSLYFQTDTGATERSDGASWESYSGGGTGDVTGPGSSTDNAVVRWDSTGGTAIQNSTVTVGDTGIVTGVTFPNTGLNVLDTNASHTLNLKPGSDLTANRTLTVTTGDADRTLTIAGTASVIGTNTGDVTVGGENYLALAAQAITAMPVNLGGSNVTGTLPLAALGATGTPSVSTFLRGDGSWAVPSGAGDVSGPGAAVTDQQAVVWNGTTGTDVEAFTGTGVVKAASGVLSASAVDLTTEVTGDLPLSNLAQSGAASKLLGRGDSGAGDYESISLGTGLSMSGTTLNAAGGGGTVTTTGSPASGEITKFSGASSITTAVKGSDVVSPVEFNAGNSGTSLTINWNDGNQQLVALTGNVTFTFSNPVAGMVYRLILQQDGTGGRTVSWPSSVKFENSTSPTLVTTANNVTFCTFVYTTLGSDGYLGFCTTNPIAAP